MISRNHTVSVLDAIAETVQRCPDRIAVCGANTEWTYGRLWEEAERVQHTLRAASCPPESRVLLALPPGPGWVAALLGLWKAGTTPVLCNVEHPPERLRTVSEAAEFVLCDEETSVIAWPEHLVRIVLDGLSQHVTELAEVPVPTAACVLHTSGSTGRPKPVLLEHAGLADRIARFQPLYGITEADRIAQVAAPSVDVVLWETLLALTAGARLDIPVGAERIPGPRLAEWLSNRDITVLACTPTMLAAMPEQELPDLRLIVLGGEQLDPGRVRYWIKRHQVANAYGPTEATIATHVCPEVPEADTAPIGHPVAGVEDYVLDQHRRPVGVGDVGVLYLGGTGLAAGYDGMPEATATAFPTVHLDGRAQRLYCTGDRVYRRNDGQLVFVGRADRQLNLGGYRLEPGEVESAAVNLPGVTAAALLAEGESCQHVLVLHAAVPTETVTATDLRAHLARVLPSPAVPGRVRVWRELPTTDSGKPDLAALARESAPASPGDPLESSDRQEGTLPEKVVHWWTEATGAQPELGTDFFESGGDSLAAVRLLHEINEYYGTDITVTDFVGDPTPEHLARSLASTEEETS